MIWTSVASAFSLYLQPPAPPQPTEPQQAGAPDPQPDEADQVGNDTREVDYNKFSRDEIDRELGQSPDLNQSFLDQCKIHLDAIEQEYTTMFELRCEINGKYMGFKDVLKLPEDADLSKCYRVLRQHVGRRRTLHLNCDDNKIEIEIDDDAGDIPKQAVDKFNSMLKQCREFLPQLNGAIARVRAELPAFERESAAVQIQATVVAKKRARKQLCLLEDWGREIQNIIEDTESLSGNLQANNTFEHTIIPE